MRASGILLPVSSLPSKYGIGCFSEEAYEFVDQLARAGQKYWQILPLGPTGYGDSPYQSFSTFAGNPYFIDLEAFVKEGYLDKSDCEDCDWGTNESYVDYEKIYNSRFRLLRKAFENYDCETDQEYRKAVYKEALDYIVDYAVEIPVYQRQECMIYSAERVNADSIVKDPTPFWNYRAEIEKIQMN